MIQLELEMRKNDEIKKMKIKKIVQTIQKVLN
jgi:hypothetical protein